MNKDFIMNMSIIGHAMRPATLLSYAGFLVTFTVFQTAWADHPNPAFGEDGWVADQFLIGDVDNDGNDAALQADGKIVVVGENDGDEQDTIVVRYNTDGTLDTTFDGNGKVRIDASGDDYGNAVAIQADGKIVVAGLSYSNGQSDFMLLRLNADGSLDTGFGNDGIVVTDLSGIEEAEDVAIQADGKIVVVGSTFDSVAQLTKITVLRYNSDGSLDNSFDADGVATIAVDGDSSDASSVALQADGKIVIGGSSGDFSQSFAVVVRYNTDGSLDTTFDGDGIAKYTTQGIAGGMDSLAVQADQKIVGITSVSVFSGAPDFVEVTSIRVLRFNTNGSLDTGFDSDGIADLAVAQGDTHGTSIAIQPDGKIVVAGQNYEFNMLDFERYFDF